MEDFIVRSDQYADLRLRTVSEQDLDNLRKWKNKNKRSFFFQEEITDIMQRDWYRNYLAADNGYMFMVEELPPLETSSVQIHTIGCMGFRKCNSGGVDLYNIIRGEASVNCVSMRSAMRLLVSFVSIWDKRISCKVLPDNPAREWYLEVGFAVEEQFEDYILMRPKENIQMVVGMEIIKVDKVHTHIAELNR